MIQSSTSPFILLCIYTINTFCLIFALIDKKIGVSIVQLTKELVDKQSEPSVHVPIRTLIFISIDIETNLTIDT